MGLPLSGSRDGDVKLESKSGEVHPEQDQPEDHEDGPSAERASGELGRVWKTGSGFGDSIVQISNPAKGEFKPEKLREQQERRRSKW